MQNVRLQQIDGLDHFNARLIGLSLESDEVADATSDASETMPAEDPSPPVPQQTATRALRDITTTVILPTLSMVLNVTVTVAGSSAQRLDLSTGTTVDEDNGIQPAADPVPSTTAALDSGRRNIVAVHVSDDVCDDDDETGGLSCRECVQVCVRRGL